jgi:hypothetical protein
MNKSLFLIPLLLFSCSKKEGIHTSSEKQNPLDSTNQIVVKNFVDTLNGVVNLPTKSNSKNISQAFRAIEDNKIIKTINGDMLPLKISDEFTKDQTQLIVKIKNFKEKKISGEIVSNNNEMNIRFNQIKLPNGEYDGPFGKNISENISERGEIWLIIGKSNMASGESSGKFTISLK